MNRLLSVLIAAAFTVFTFSAVAEEAMAPAKPTAATSEKKATPKQLAQREKLKLCNKEAKEKGLKKAERKTFMKSCLKKA